MSESRDERVVNLLGALALALTDRTSDATEAVSGMTGVAATGLIALQQFLGGRSTEDLAQATGLTHSGAVRLVDRLANVGYVERRAGRDGRSSSIVLTASGRAMSRRITKARAAAIAPALEDLGGDDRRALGDLIEQMLTTVTRQRLAARVDSDHSSAWLCRMCDFAACGRSLGDCPAANAAVEHHDRSRPPETGPAC